jgi:hypothetical protein
MTATIIDSTTERDENKKNSYRLISANQMNLENECGLLAADGLHRLSDTAL